MATALQHPSHEWSSLQDVFYRKTDIYTLTWGIDDLSNFHVAAARNGGLLALVRDPTKVVAMGRSALLKQKIHIYTSAGQLVESIPWDSSDRIVGLGFTLDEQLVVVLDEGIVRIYTLFSPCPSPPRQDSSANASTSSNSLRHPIEATTTSYYTQHQLGQEATDTGIVTAHVYDAGLAALTGAGRFVEWRFPVRSDEGRGMGSSLVATTHPQVLPSWGEDGPPSSLASWSVVPSECSSSGTTQVLVSPKARHTVIALDTAGDASDMKLSRGPFAAMRPSPNGRLLALVTSDWKLWVVSSDFERSLSEFDLTTCDAFRQPQGSATMTLQSVGMRQIEWCGNNTVAVAWESEVVMIGPFGDSIRYFYGSPVHMVSELDGLRIIGSDRHEFVQKASDSSVSIFLPGSTHPGAILFDAAEQYANRSAKADEGVRAIRRDLEMAVDTCLDAAAQEWDVTWQKKLMRAASFGRSFIDMYDPTRLVEIARVLRVLNAARRYEIGFPISFEEYQDMTPEVLIKRLTNRNHHLLCLHIASYLNVRPDAILQHWALGKVARSRPAVGALSQGIAPHSAAAKADDETCKAIVDKLKMQPAISFADIARSAWNAGRTRLATKLLDHEPRAVDQVPLLLTMHEDKLALMKAIESGDTDLVYHVLLRLKGQLSRGDFFRIVQAPIADATAPAKDGSARAKPSPASYVYLASNLLENYAKQEDTDLLQDFYFQDDRRSEAALLSLHRASRQKDVSAKVQDVKEAQRLFGEDKECVLEAKLSEEYVRLLGLQAALEKEEPRASFVGLSVNETIRTCLMRNMSKRADKIRSDFKVPERRFWHLKISALIATRDTEGLWSFATSKKSPIGYTPFISHLAAAGYSKEALRYVPKAMNERTDKTRLRALLPRLPAREREQISKLLEDA